MVYNTVISINESLVARTRYPPDVFINPIREHACIHTHTHPFWSMMAKAAVTPGYIETCLTTKVSSPIKKKKKKKRKRKGDEEKT